MNRTWIRFWTIIALVFSCLNVSAQTSQGSMENWFLLLNKAKITDKFYVTDELHLRRHDWLKDQKQFIWRPAINYKVHPNVALTAGYTYILTTPVVGDDISTPENQVFLEATVKQKFSDRWALLHRFRQENRFIGQKTFDETGNQIIDGSNYSQRFRYRITLKGTLLKGENNKKLYTHIFNEIWLDQSKLRPTDINRNWVYLGVGYQFQKNARVELAYLDQWTRTGDTGFKHSPTLQMTVGYDFDFRKKKPATVQGAQ